MEICNFQLDTGEILNITVPAEEDMNIVLSNDRPIEKTLNDSIY